jgi:hypothetical protein
MEIGFPEALLLVGGLLMVAAALSGVMGGTVLSISVLSVGLGIGLAEAGVVEVAPSDETIPSPARPYSWPATRPTPLPQSSIRKSSTRDRRVGFEVADEDSATSAPTTPRSRPTGATSPSTRPPTTSTPIPTAMFLAGLIAQRDLTVSEMLDRYELFMYKQWLRVYMRSKMIFHNKSLLETIDDRLALLDKLRVY